MVFSKKVNFCFEDMICFVRRFEVFVESNLLCSKMRKIQHMIFQQCPGSIWKGSREIWHQSLVNPMPQYIRSGPEGAQSVSDSWRYWIWPPRSTGGLLLFFQNAVVSDSRFARPLATNPKSWEKGFGNLHNK